MINLINLEKKLEERIIESNKPLRFKTIGVRVSIPIKLIKKDKK